MNTQAIRILFLKDLFLSRKPLFAYFVGGLICAALACTPVEIISFTGFILAITIAIATGMHLIGSLLLGESSEHTRLFIMSLPVSLLDYSIAKIAVVLTTYLIPWCSMLALFTVLSLIVPGAKPGAVAVVPTIFCYMLAAFTTQVVTAVITESLGWTIGIVVAGNVLLNVFLKTIFENEIISAAAKSDVLTWPPIVLQILAIEIAIVIVAVCVALVFQSRRRDLA